MKKQVVNCETGDTEVVDIPAEEESFLLAESEKVEAHANDPKPKTTEERIEELEQIVENLTRNGQ